MYSVTDSIDRVLSAVCGRSTSPPPPPPPVMSLESSFLALFLKCSAAVFSSELFSLPRNGSERHSESFFLFLFHGMEFRVVFSSAEWFGTEFREFASIFVPRNAIQSCFLFRGRARNGNSESFLFRGTAGIPSEITICSVYSVFRGIIFLSEIPNPNSQYDIFDHNIPHS
jgi:hypothetical protein